jgi:fructokinase
VPTQPVEVVDTIGAGDAFGGGFVAWWHRRGLRRGALAELDAVRQATAFAVTVAAFTCTRAGAQPPRISELSASAAPPAVGQASDASASL